MYTIADILIRVKNAQAVKKERLLVPFSKVKWEVTRLLKEKKFIADFERRKKKGPKAEHLYIEIKLNQGTGGISGLRVISKPSRRVYLKKSQIKPVLGGYGMGIISTPKGLMTGEEARRQNLGGEWLAEVW